MPGAFLAGAAMLAVAQWLARAVRSSIGLVLIFSRMFFVSTCDDNFLRMHNSFETINQLRQREQAAHLIRMTGGVSAPLRGSRQREPPYRRPGAARAAKNSLKPRQ